MPLLLPALRQIKGDISLNLKPASEQGSVVTGPTCLADKLSDSMTRTGLRQTARIPVESSSSFARSPPFLSLCCYSTLASFPPSSLPLGASNFTLVRGETHGSQNRKYPLLGPIATNELVP